MGMGEGIGKGMKAAGSALAWYTSARHEGNAKMGFFSRLLGAEDESGMRQAPRGSRPQPPPEDAQAVERYRYMVQTAPPETLEQAHAEAFAKLTPEQRRLLLNELAQAAPPQERAAIEATSSEDPRALARVATRAEVRQPGVMERTLGGSGMGFGGGLLSSFAAGFVGSMVAQSFFSAMGGFGDHGGAEGHEANAGDGDVGTEAHDGDDFGGDDFGGDDFGG
jgi:hypothetical protein